MGHPSKERDTETGLDYFGARYYSNGLGRFVTPDWDAKATAIPYADFADPQSLNLYTYVRNVPTTRFDPDGHNYVFSPFQDWGMDFYLGQGRGTSTVEDAPPQTQPGPAPPAPAPEPTSDPPPVQGPPPVSGGPVLVGVLGGLVAYEMINLVADIYNAEALKSSTEVANSNLQIKLLGELANSKDAPEPQAAAGGQGKRPHGNTAGSQYAELYALYDKNGKFLKWGVSQNAATRYSAKELAGGRAVVIATGERFKMLAIERTLSSYIPGPKNLEPWAGSKP